MQGLIVIITAETMLLTCAGVFNPTFVTYRMKVTSDRHMSRVGAAWAISSKSFQPVFITAAGLLAAVTSLRTTITVAAAILIVSAALLPWRTTTEVDSAPTRPA
jgi:hypothetical protein